MTDEPRAEPAPLNTLSVVGLVVFGLLGVAGLFGLPALQARGVGFYTGFWLVAAVELVAALGVAASVLTLRRGRD